MATIFTLKEHLPDLLREHFGSKVELLNYKIVNQHHHYLVLLAELQYPNIKVAIKLAGPEAEYPCPFDRTATLHQLVRSYTTLQMPEVFAVDVSYQKWPWRYFIKSYLPGQEWAVIQPQLNRAELTETFQHIGNAVAQLHTIQFPSYGELTVQGQPEKEQPYLTALIERANRRINNPRLHELFVTVVNNNKALFTEINTASLCHEDLHKHNILFQQKAGKWQLATILDFDSAWAGFYETDLARLDLWRGMMDKAFWEAYKPIHPLEPLYQQRRPIYQLLWCLEYAQPTTQHLLDTQQVCTELGIAAIESFE